MNDLEKKNKKIYKISKLKASLVCVGLFGVALSLGYWIGYVYNLQQTRNLLSGILPVRENNFNYKFIYPMLGYTFGNAKYLIEDHALEKKINNYLENQNHNNDSVAVYYRNLLNNRWSGVNSNDQYHPGSMMKVTVMMAYYRQQQLDPSILQKTLVYTANVNHKINSFDFGQPSRLTVGQSYSIEQLIEAMIESSDNGADILLLDNVDRKILNDVFHDLKIKTPDETNDFTISAAQYGDFLRILYNSTYLTEAYSEQALSLMSKSTFNKGISSGLPTSVNTAQKYGEFLDTEASGTNIKAIELSNCGIIYAQNNPYELCVMTKGSYDGKGQADEQRLASIIKDVSSIVYDYVSTSGQK